MSDPILVAKGESELFLLPRMANRHGLIAGATGTGKTVTLQRLAEGLSRLGVPTFMADVKGDLSGISRAGSETPKVKDRVTQLGLTTFQYADTPVMFWDVFGEQGHPVRATVSEMGPLLFSRLLNLNEVQSGVLALTFKVADDNGLLLLDLKDLRAMVQFVGDHAKEFTSGYGNVSTASIGAIQRGLLALEQQGGDKFLGEPALDLMDWMQTDAKGRGMVNLLAADKLMQSPTLYATFLLWMLSELFERLPEVGDLDKPKLVFFFDEAHLLFDNAPPTLLDKIQQVVRLVRSKGVGVFFVTQNPLDIPDTVLGQLGNRVQHALRAFTPRDQKAVAAAARTFRQNPKLDVASVIGQLGVGEALVSFLDEKGTPTMVERGLIVPPGGQIGPITPVERQAIMKGSLVFGHYEQVIDRESAYEILQKRAGHAEAPAASAGKTPEERRAEFEKHPADAGKPAKAAAQKPGFFEKLFQAFGTSAARAAGTAATREITRGVLGGIFGGAGGRKRR
jgi:DNA helicase HerA-like ATPase